MSEKILIIDNDKNLLSTYKNQLKTTFNIEVATSGEIALKLLEDDKDFAVVITELKMPDIGGIEIIEDLKKSYPKIIRILLTDYPEPKNFVAAINEGEIFHFLPKPCPLVVLKKTIQSAIKKFKKRSEEDKKIETYIKEIDALRKIIKGKKGKEFSDMEVIILLNEIFAKVRKGGAIKLESHLDNPETSSIFTEYPNFLKRHEPLMFLTDSFRTIITAKIAYYDLNGLLEEEIETLHEEHLNKAESLNQIAESFPGLGIVAAVLGVVITMQKISEPPEVLGHSIGAALVGTFLGVLLCYGFVGPMARKMKILAESEKEYLTVIKTIIIFFVSGINPKIALEFGRRSIPGHLRPRFLEMEEKLKEIKKISPGVSMKN